MDKSPQNDLADGSLPEQSSGISICELAQSSSDHDAEEEVCASKKVVNIVAPVDGGITHQTGRPRPPTNCETELEPCQSIQEGMSHDSCEQPVPDLHLNSRQGSLSKNITQAQTVAKVSSSEGIQTFSELSHETGFPNGSVKCSCESGCDDISPNQDLKGGLCATVDTDLTSMSEMHESCVLIESPGSVDGRERFSENSDLSQELNAESISSSEGTQLLCDKGDQTCTSSVSVDSGIQSKLTDIESNVKQCYDPGHLCTSAHGTSCCVSDKLCKHSLFKTLAASVVDEVLEVAAKRLLELESQDRIFDVRKISSNSENIEDQVSVLRDVTGGDGDAAVKHVNCSLDVVPDQIFSHVSNSDNVTECLQCSDEKLNSQVDSCVNVPTPIICNGNVLTSSYSIYLHESSPTLNLSNLECASNVSECDNSVIVKEPVKEDDSNSDAKCMSSKDDLYRCDDLDKIVKEIPSPENEFLCQAKSDNLSEVSRYDTVEVSLPDQNLNFEAKVQSSKDALEEADVKNVTVSNGACLIDSSSHVAYSQKEIMSCSVTPVLCTSLDESPDLNLNKQEPSMEVVIKLDDLTASSSCHVDDNSDLNCADPKLDGLDYVCGSSVSSEMGCDVDLSMAKAEKEAVDYSSFQGNTEKPKLISAEKDEVNTDCDGSNSALTSKTVGGKFLLCKEENLVVQMIPTTESAPVSPQEETEEKLITSPVENLVKQVIPSAEIVPVLTQEEIEKTPITSREEKLLEEVIPSVDSAPVSPQQETEETCGGEENLVEEEIPTSVSPKEERECILGKEENLMDIATVGCTPEEIEKLIEEEEYSIDEFIPTADSSASDSSHDNVEYSKLVVEEPKSEEVSLKDDISASVPLLGNPEDFADEEHNPTAFQVPLAKLELVEANVSNHSGGNGHIPLSPVPCQLIVPAVNVCPPIMEETCDGITDDESEISHATSESESDLNVKMVKPACDGMNTINYKPLLEEDSNDRSTLSLISELDENSIREDNLEQWEDESVIPIMDEKVDKDNFELVQRVKGQRIRHDMKEGATSCEEEPLEGSRKTEFAAKIIDIEDALKSGSLERLQELAKSEGGLVNDDLRREAWPRLLGIEPSVLTHSLPPINKEDLRKHHEYNQVVLDVNRSLRRFPSKTSPEERVSLQDQLTEIILRVLMKRKDLFYYQGYHDVAVTTLLVAGKDAAFHILERISTEHLSDCMQRTMDRTMFLLNYIYPLIQRINPQLSERMDRLEVGTIFCLPWYLTWYGYSLKRYDDIVRVFDYFLASPRMAPLYLAAEVVGRRSAEVLAADSDHATVHSLLSRIPETLPLEELLRDATDLYRKYPPDDIENEVHERVERLRKAQEKEEEERKRIRERRMVRRHSMPAIAARQMQGLYILDRLLGLRLPMFQGRRIVSLSATVVFGMLAWHLRTEVYRYF